MGKTKRKNVVSRSEGGPSGRHCSKYARNGMKKHDRTYTKQKRTALKNQVNNILYKPPDFNKTSKTPKDSHPNPDQFWQQNQTCYSKGWRFTEEVKSMLKEKRFARRGENKIFIGWR